MEILLPAWTEAQAQAQSAFKGADPADLDSLVTGQKEPPPISRRRKPGSSPQLQEGCIGSQAAVQARQPDGAP